MRLLVAVDLSPLSEALVRFATGLASRMDGDVVALHAFTTGDAAGALQEAGLSFDRYLEHLRGEMQRVLAGAGAPEVQVRLVVAQGDPAATIVEQAARGGIDLIVVGTHGRTGLARLLLGSVAEGVLRHAPCPVVVVPWATVTGEGAVGATTAAEER